MYIDNNKMFMYIYINGPYTYIYIICPIDITTEHHNHLLRAAAFGISHGWLLFVRSTVYVFELPNAED